MKFNWKEYEPDIRNSLEQLERCISILVPKSDELFTNEDFNLQSSEKSTKTADELVDEFMSSKEDESSDDEDDFVEVPTKKTKEELDEERYVELRYLGILNEDKTVAAMTIEDFKNAPLTIDLHLRENDENKVVIEIMRDLYKELKKSSLVRINNWIKVNFTPIPGYLIKIKGIIFFVFVVFWKNFTQIKTASNNMKRAIELKNSIQEALKRFENLNIIDQESAVKAERRNEANERIKSLVRNSVAELAEDDPEKPGTSKSKGNTVPLNEKEKKKQEMLKVVCS